ncbi:hypothetical protein [Arthrobacter roseus]|uniref:hypothetical protein n=1 Tax=Arthrobacter roseus TaxID=136274 RepID=UPI001EF899E7|nr:hypothetical protein [Arthrobacter roseus]MBM7848327.1 hypothetical protein [Arthrobacter roseus]
MSQGNQSQTAEVGNTVRKLSVPEHWVERPVRRRTPLALVAPVPVRQRVPFAVFCSAVLIVALAAVMLINISVSTGQYKLVRLAQEETALKQQNEALTQQAENLRAPQHLAAEAAQLGMVASPSFGYVDLKAMKVHGDPKPAGKDDEPLVTIPPAETGSPETSGEESEQAVDEPAVQTPSAEDAGALSPEPAPEHTAPELNGGTVPAPQQKTGQ